MRYHCESFRKQLCNEKIIPWLLVLLLPIVTFLLSDSILMQAGYVDPYFYTGYVHNYPDLLERYGRTYLSARISFIYPERVLVWLLGSKAGYYLFRYILLAAVLASFWKISRTYYSKIISIFVVFFVAFNPWLLRSLYYDYCDGVSIIYLIIALHFLISKYTSKIFPYVFSGIFFAMATNCKIFALGIGGIFLPCWIILQRHENINQVLKKIFFIAIGFLGCYICLFSVQYIEFPQYNPFFEIVALKTAKLALAGKHSEYWYSFQDIFSPNNSLSITIVFPIFVLFVSFFSYLILRRNNMLLNHRLGVAILLYLFLTTLLFLAIHFFCKIGVFSWFYQISYNIPATLLMITWLLGEFLSSSVRKKQLLFVTISGIIYIIFLWASQLDFIQNINSLYLIFIYSVFFIFLIISLFIFQARNFIRTSIILIVVSFSPFFFLSPVYNVFSFSKKISSYNMEWDVYKGAIQLQKWISIIPSYGSIKFWYRDEGTKFSSIQSAMLWGPEHNMLTPDMKMPQLDKMALENLNALDYLVILGETSEQILEAQQAINQALAGKPNIKMSVIMEGSYNSDTINYFLLVLEKKNNLDINKFIGDIRSTIRASNNSLLAWQPENFLLKTTTQRWTPSATVFLRNYMENQHEITMNMKIRVKKGRLGIGVLDKNSKQYVFEKSIPITAESVVLTVGSHIMKDASYLIFYNDTEIDRETEVEINEINLFKNDILH